MAPVMSQSDRYHSLDSLRATMMLLGIVLHAAMNYMTIPLPGYFYQDQQTAAGVDLIFYAIHSFRMPVFFIMAGFFAAMLYVKRGQGAMLRNRFQRIGIPFAIFWPLLFTANILVFLLGIHYIAYQRLGIDMNLVGQYFTPSPDDETFNTTHLWFLYYLLQYYLLSIPALWLLAKSPNVAARLDRAFFFMLSKPLGILLLTAPIALLGYFEDYGRVEPSFSFIPQWQAVLYYALFFIAGAYLHQHQKLLAQYRSYFSVYAASALLIFLILIELHASFASGNTDVFLAIVFFANVLTWVASLASIGFFVRFFAVRSAWTRYLTDSAYWVYLVHLIFTVSFAVMMHDWALNVWLKFALNCVLTALMCLASYHCFVRNTFIGQLLNGRRYSSIDRQVHALAKTKQA